MKRLPALALALAVLLMPACSGSSHHVPIAVILHEHQFSAELATDEASREYGLMNRKTLAADRGMLFVFVDENPRGFWMKNTRIPLDILYFDTNHRLVSVQADVPPCKADPCPTYPSAGPARYVLELSAGTAKRIGVQAGDVLKIDGDVGPVR